MHLPRLPCREGYCHHPRMVPAALGRISRTDRHRAVRQQVELPYGQIARADLGHGSSDRIDAEKPPQRAGGGRDFGIFLAAPPQPGRPVRRAAVQAFVGGKDDDGGRIDGPFQILDRPGHRTQPARVNAAFRKEKLHLAGRGAVGQESDAAVAGRGYSQPVGAGPLGQLHRGARDREFPDAAGKGFAPGHTGRRQGRQHSCPVMREGQARDAGQTIQPADRFGQRHGKCPHWRKRPRRSIRRRGQRSCVKPWS